MISDDCENTTHSVDEYMIGRGEMEDRLILLMSPAMSCLMKLSRDLSTKKSKTKTGLDSLLQELKLVLTGALNAGWCPAISNIQHPEKQQKRNRENLISTLNHGHGLSY